MKFVCIIIGFLLSSNLYAQTLSSDDGWHGFGKKWHGFSLNNLPITSKHLDGYESFFKLPGENMRTDDLYMPFLSYFGAKGNVSKIRITVLDKIEGAFGKEDYRTQYDTEVYFDSKSRLVQEKHSRIVNVVHPTGNSIYDDEGYLKEVSVTDVLKLVYERDEKRRVVKVNAIDTHTRYVFTYQYTIDDYIKSIKVYDSDAKLCGTVDYKYDKENRLVELLTKNIFTNMDKATKQHFNYDTNNSISWYKVYNNLKYKPEDYDYYGYDNRYDNLKNIVEVVMESGNVRENVLNSTPIFTENEKVISNIKYDSNGNWVEIKQDDRRIIRQITYKDVDLSIKKIENSKDFKYDRAFSFDNGIGKVALMYGKDKNGFAKYRYGLVN